MAQLSKMQKPTYTRGYGARNNIEHLLAKDFTANQANLAKASREKISKSNEEQKEDDLDGSQRQLIGNINDSSSKPGSVATPRIELNSKKITGIEEQINESTKKSMK